MSPAASDFFPLLKQVSRSFYLTLRVLPAGVRPQIGLAYLLARATDTIADTQVVPVERRLETLRELRDWILGIRAAPVPFDSFVSPGTSASANDSGAERQLLLRTEELMAAFSHFAPADQQRIREVLATVISGQELDLKRFGQAGAQRIVALSTEAELDDYTYRVAGCVGGFWTKMCRAHVFPQHTVPLDWLVEHGVRFGKGLQLVNVLRDLPTDLRQGRCYLPDQRLHEFQIEPADLLDAKNEPRIRPLYHELLGRAEEHLRAGWTYTQALPRAAVRVRLACAWPILIGVQTLARLRQQNVLDERQRVKVSRSDVRRVIIGSVLRYPVPAAWNALFERARM